MDIPAPTSAGRGRLVVDAAPHPNAVLWLGHGAGGGIESPDLVTLAAALPGLGITVVRFEQPWRTAGRRLAPRPAALDTAWLEASPLVHGLADALPLVVGGRSAGARVACRTAASVGAAGVVCLAFPLHPPGRPDKSRLDELLEPKCPVLVLQGERDTFGTAAEVAAGLGAAPDPRPAHRTVMIPGADHALKVAVSSTLGPSGVADLLVTTVTEFVRALP